MVGNKGSRGDRSPEQPLPPPRSPVLLTERNAIALCLRSLSLLLFLQGPHHALQAQTAASSTTLGLDF